MSNEKISRISLIQLYVVGFGFFAYYLVQFSLQFIIPGDTSTPVKIKFFIIFFTALFVLLKCNLKTMVFALLISFIFFFIEFVDLVKDFNVPHLRVHSLNDMFLAIVFSFLMEKSKHINLRKINSYLFYVFIGVLITFLSEYFSNNNFSSTLRLHSIWIFIISLTLLGVHLSKINAYFLLILTILFSHIYESRLILGVATLYFIFHNEKGMFKRLLLIGFIFGALILYNFYSRFAEIGLTSLGREFIYTCFQENFTNLSFFGSSYNILASCNIYGYLHSSYLEFIQRYGIALFLISIAFLLIEFYRNLIFKNKQIIMSYLLILAFSFFEGGFEWFFIFLFYTKFSMPSDLSRTHSDPNNIYRRFSR